MAFIQTLDALDSLLPEALRKPLVGIVCGSGLSGLVESFHDVVIVPYDKLPGFAKSTGVSSFSFPCMVINTGDRCWDSSWA